MDNIVIQVENLSKKYLLGHHKQERYSALRDVIAFAITSLGKKLLRPTDRQNSNKREEFWALKDVSFQIKQGEVVGIIGRNGAGKSTLLKILSRITEPTTGRVKINGRVASLLEVGTGFHPELTGRENIYLNGSILGMSKVEIKNKFDEIVAFAEVEKFLDTPVKRYSSGMYVRLAFAVAAHLEPEILVVDEVLAVGDIAFQKKCLGKMDDVTKAGRTVLFVSHNMGTIRSLCQSAIWLEKGNILKIGNCHDVVREYEGNQFKNSIESHNFVQRDREDIKTKDFYLKSVKILNEEEQDINIFRYGEKITVKAYFGGCSPTKTYNFELRIYNELSQFICVCSSAFQGKLLDRTTKAIQMEIGPLPLTVGHYTISLRTTGSQQGSKQSDEWENCLVFEIIDCSPFVGGQVLRTREEGICAIEHSLKKIESIAKTTLSSDERSSFNSH